MHDNPPSSHLDCTMPKTPDFTCACIHSIAAMRTLYPLCAHLRALQTVCDNVRPHTCVRARVNVYEWHECCFLCTPPPPLPSAPVLPYLNLQSHPLFTAVCVTSARQKRACLQRSSGAMVTIYTRNMTMMRPWGSTWAPSAIWNPPMSFAGFWTHSAFTTSPPTLKLCTHRCAAL